MDLIADNARALARHARRLRAAARSGSSRPSPAPFDLALFTDERAGNPLSVIEALPRLPGVRLAVIFRHYDTPDRADLARAVAGSVRRAGHLLIVGGDADLAMACRADGLHLPEYRLSQLPGLRHSAPGMIVSVACHSRSALIRAQALGADCAFFSPVFDTASHPDAAGLGSLNASQHVAKLSIPVLALGGINAQNAGKIKPGLFAGFGAIDGFTQQAR